MANMDSQIKVITLGPRCVGANGTLQGQGAEDGCYALT